MILFTEVLSNSPIRGLRYKMSKIQVVSLLLLVTCFLAVLCTLYCRIFLGNQNFSAEGDAGYRPFTVMASKSTSTLWTSSVTENGNTLVQEIVGAPRSLEFSPSIILDGRHLRCFKMSDSSLASSVLNETRDKYSLEISNLASKSRRILHQFEKRETPYGYVYYSDLSTLLVFVDLNGPERGDDLFNSRVMLFRFSGDINSSTYSFNNEIFDVPNFENRLLTFDASESKPIFSVVSPSTDLVIYEVGASDIRQIVKRASVIPGDDEATNQTYSSHAILANQSRLCIARLSRISPPPRDLNEPTGRLNVCVYDWQTEEKYNLIVDEVVASIYVPAIECSSNGTIAIREDNRFRLYMNDGGMQWRLFRTIEIPDFTIHSLDFVEDNYVFVTGAEEVDGSLMSKLLIFALWDDEASSDTAVLNEEKE
jgi:hypothetical protein